MRLPDNPAVAELAKLRPAKLRVFSRGSEDAKAVAIPGNRKKWETLAHTLDGLDWERIEALDPRGNIVGVVARPEEDDEPDEVELASLDAAEAARDERLLQLMLKAQQVALTAQAAQLRPLVEGMGKLVGTVTTALDATSRAYNIALAATSGVAPAAGGGESDESAGRFMQMVMMLLAQQGQPKLASVAGVVSAAQQAAAKPAVPRQSKPNGAPPTSTPPAPGH
jgi:hypothetical protein